MSVSDTVTINFSDKSDCDFIPYLEADKTSCKSGDDISIKLYAKEMADFPKLKLYEGSRQLNSQSIKLINDTIEEGIAFNDTYTAKTTKPIQSIISSVTTTEMVYYNGQAFINIFPSGTNLSCSILGDICVDIINNINPKRLLIGSLDINYLCRMYSKEYIWKAPVVTKITQYPFFLTYNNARMSTLNIQVEPLSIEKDMTIVIKDVANDTTISGASITINGGGNTFTGTTNINGECNFRLFTNINYDIKVVASGYINTDVDYLNNDSFVIT